MRGDPRKQGGEQGSETGRGRQPGKGVLWPEQVPLCRALLDCPLPHLGGEKPGESCAEAFCLSWSECKGAWGCPHGWSRRLSRSPQPGRPFPGSREALAAQTPDWGTAEQRKVIHCRLDAWRVLPGACLWGKGSRRKLEELVQILAQSLTHWIMFTRLISFLSLSFLSSKTRLILPTLPTLNA